MYIYIRKYIYISDIGGWVGKGAGYDQAPTSLVCLDLMFLVLSDSSRFLNEGTD